MMNAGSVFEGASGAAPWLQRRPLPVFAVVISAFTERRWDDLLRAVDSVRSQTLPPSEIVLVIDHAAALLERARGTFRNVDNVRVIANEESKGLSGARNTGIKATSSQVVAFLDDDAVAEPTWLESLAPAYADPLVFGVGGTVQPEWDQVRPTWFPEEFDWVVGCSYRGQPRHTSVVRNVIGCNMSFRREVFDEVGGFRRELGRVDTVPAGCEETELCIRARERYPFGQMVLEPQAVVHHRVTTDRTTWRYFRNRCLAEGRSKAIMCGVVGEAAGLASERSYTTRVLPAAVIRNLFSPRSKGRRSRALVIITGFVLVAFGYVRGRLTPSDPAGLDG